MKQSIVMRIILRTLVSKQRTPAFLVLAIAIAVAEFLAGLNISSHYESSLGSGTAYGSTVPVLKQELSLTVCDACTRAAYHYGIRQLKKNENLIVRERVAEAILSDGGRNFWSEIKRIRSHKSSNSRIVDGQTDVSAIARLFAAKYRELYTSVPFNKDDMQCIVDDVNDSIKGESTYSVASTYGGGVWRSISKIFKTGGLKPPSFDRQNVKASHAHESRLA